MWNLNDSGGITWQYLMEAWHSIVTFLYLIVMRTGQYFQMLHVKLQTITGPSGADLISSFMPIVFVIILLLLMSSFVSWFANNFEVSFG